MKIFRTVVVLFYIPVVMVMGCYGCNNKAPAPVHDDAGMKLQLSIQKIFDATDNFSYDHDFLVLINQDKDKNQNREQVSIVGEHGKILFQKSIDEDHFLMIAKEDNKYSVKNRLGPWRSGAENKAMYEDIIGDGIGLLPWFLKQFSLEKSVANEKDIKNNRDIWRIDEKTVPDNAPFVVDLKKKYPKFNMQTAKVSGRIEIDALTKLPLMATLSVELIGVNEQSIKISSQSSLTLNSIKTVTMPEILEEESIPYPVNIVPRFNELFKDEFGYEN